MNRWWRVCVSAGVGRRGLVVCIGVSLLVTLTLWFRCDDVTTGHGTVHDVTQHAVLDRNPVVSDNEYVPDDIVAEDDGGDGTDLQYHGRGSLLPASKHLAPLVGYHAIECLINGEYSVTCRQDDEGEVYLPFSFIGKYFEVYGKMSENGDKFTWQHSYSRVYAPQHKYSPDGVFMSFEHYNVEVRERVKCISAIEGVPVSTQWGPQGYYYPTQIAQYGLNHYSKYVKAGSGDHNVEVVEDAEHGNTEMWTVEGDGKVENILDPDTHSRVIEFHSSDAKSEKADVILALPESDSVDIRSGFFLSFNIRFVTNGSVTVTVETAHHRTIRVHYVCSDTLLTTSGEEIFYGIGTNRTAAWGPAIGRDITVDIQKGIQQKYLGRKKRPPRVVLSRITSIQLRGVGQIDNITLSDDAHLMQFFYAADWLVRWQDQRGGWPISVLRSLADGQLTLAPGWYSAMAQGHAMSVLVRAYVRTGRAEYLTSAVRALELFDVASSDGGVVARFMERHVWYEEYPTSPPSFVLNGFMYSLVGLYDVARIAPAGRDAASRLFAAGIQSLRTLLPLFDTGSGSVYDLRHLTLGGRSAPNRARWDYHATHVNQLLLIASLLSDTDKPASTELEAVARRWIGYMKGKLAPHN